MPTPTTTLTCTRSSSLSTISTPASMGGYRVDLEITEAVNISPKVFIFQREVVTTETDTFVDTFYSVASVEQMESVPESPTEEFPFYRKSSVSLVFATNEALEKYVGIIQSMLTMLRQANDRALAMLPPVPLPT